MTENRSATIEETVKVLRAAGVVLDDPLDAREVAEVEARLEITFSPDHAALLRTCLPVGDAWPDWRDGTTAGLETWIDGPVRGVLFDVSTNDFWPASWGARSVDPAEALDAARLRVREWPRMVPLRAHRYMASGRRGRRVFSIWQTDVVCYGEDVLDWARREFFPSAGPPPGPDPDPIWPWSHLTEGAEDDDL